MDEPSYTIEGLVSAKEEKVKGGWDCREHNFLGAQKLC